MNLQLMLTKKLVPGSKAPDLSMVILDGKHRQSFYEHVIQQYKKGWDTQGDWYKQMFDRYYTANVQEHGVYRSIEAQTQSPLLIGGGQQTVLEAHITLHKTYGVPYIPGTALKGVSARLCRTYLGEQDQGFAEDGAYYKWLFGAQEQAGHIHYYDAFLTPGTVSGALRIDVLTPHHQAYNQLAAQGPGNTAGRTAEEAAAPRDDDSPEPVHFLTVQGCFRLMWSYTGPDDSVEKWLTMAEKLLCTALGEEGLGGKTNAGYGRLVASEEGSR
ncbi:type III-B CRISPR module RAMP protein Cmr6 [Paenibacillus sp. y28]|uniref:type III-B CRISPR module RAMP protein Cmr6 n=1 Tax=Paenibacillus sp. y28 TaxID=3129110 RepID=UPI003015F08A